nr:hypothetical protein [Tanacetum cinerariifolium]
MKANDVEGNYQKEMHGLLQDLFHRFSMEGSNDIDESELADDSDVPPTTQNDAKPVLNETKKMNTDKRKFDDLLKDVEQKVYPNAKHNKLFFGNILPKKTIRERLNMFSHGNKIDVYMQPLINELKELWDTRIETFDAFVNEKFYMKAAVLSTISDFLGYANLSGRICIKDLGEADLKFLESRISITLCKLEQIFPPSFFTVMVHLVIHLVREVRLEGPETFRRMDLHILKSYVNNRAYPEGSIAEGYLTQESLTFCSRYLSEVETLFTRPVRNDDDDDQNEIKEFNLLCPGRPLGQHEHSQLSCKRKRFPKWNINVLSKGNITHADYQNMNFRRFIAKFFLNGLRVSRLEEQKDPRVTEEVKWLARGPNYFVKRYLGYFVKDKGCKIDEFGLKLVNFSYLTHKGDNLLDDPFVLASQVDKVFYNHDSKLEDWMVAQHVNVKDAFNMQCDTNENILSSLPYANDMPSLHRVGVDVEDGEDGTLVLKSQEVYGEDEWSFGFCERGFVAFVSFVL